MDKELLLNHRKTGDGKVSSDSADKGERINIDDSIKGESFMVRTTRQEEEDELVPPRDLMTPTLESTPYEGHEREDKKPRSLTAPKKNYGYSQSRGREKQRRRRTERAVVVNLRLDGHA